MRINSPAPASHIPITVILTRAVLLRLELKRAIRVHRQAHSSLLTWKVRLAFPPVSVVLLLAVLDEAHDVQRAPHASHTVRAPPRLVRALQAWLLLPRRLFCGNALLEGSVGALHGAPARMHLPQS